MPEISAPSEAVQPTVIDIEEFTSVPEHSGSFEEALQQLKDGPESRLPQCVRNLGFTSVDQLIQRVEGADDPTTRAPTIRELREAKKRAAEIEVSDDKPKVTMKLETKTLENSNISHVGINRSKDIAPGLIESYIEQTIQDDQIKTDETPIIPETAKIEQVKFYGRTNIKIAKKTPIINAPINVKQKATQTKPINTPVSQKSFNSKLKISETNSLFKDEVNSGFKSFFEDATVEQTNLSAEIPLNEDTDWVSDDASPEYELLPTEEFQITLEGLFDVPQDDNVDSLQEIPEPDFGLAINTITKEDANFTPNLTNLIETLEPEVSDVAKDLLNDTTDKINLLFEDSGLTPENIAIILEVSEEQREEILNLCLELLEYIGFESNEQNANKLLLQLVKSEYATNLILKNILYESLQLERGGTHESKFGMRYTNVVGIGAANAFIRSTTTLGRLVLGIASTA